MNYKNSENQSTILVVDDNVKNLQVLGGFLKLEGIMVEFALDGTSALKWLEKKKFDLILLDIMMPGMDGYEVCSIIKKIPEISEIPVIFITAKTDSDSIVRGFETGAVDYITKPFIQSELLVRVETQLSISRSKQQIHNYLLEIEERNEKITSSITYAGYIQKAVLGTSEKYLKYLPEHFILNLPKDVLSGDFYWVCSVGEKVIISVMDCTGHGVPGALVSILGITLLNEIVLHDHIVQPDKIMEMLRAKVILALGQIIDDSHIGNGMEGIIVCYDPGKGKIQYSGSFNPLVLIHEGEITVIKADAIPISYYFQNKSFTLHELHIEHNDTLYMFSDGILDQFGGPLDKKFMIKHLKEIFLSNNDADMKLQKEIIKKELDVWKGNNDQTDDILVMGIRF